MQKRHDLGRVLEHEIRKQTRVSVRGLMLEEGARMKPSPPPRVSEPLLW